MSIAAGSLTLLDSTLFLSFAGTMTCSSSCAGMQVVGKHVQAVVTNTAEARAIAAGFVAREQLLPEQTLRYAQIAVTSASLRCAGTGAPTKLSKRRHSVV